MMPMEMDTTPTKVRVVKPRWIRGVPVEKNTVHTLPQNEARVAVQTGRVELVSWSGHDSSS